MIGKLTGIVDSLFEDHVILDVGGVGYVVHCSPRTLAQLSGQGEACALSVETQVREDSIRLYGFATAFERDWFRVLQSVQGVGARVALAIQGALSPGELATAIACQDRAALTRAPGVGAKLAARIVAELRDKAPVHGELAAPSSGGDAPAAAAAGEPASRAAADALSALVNLGYGRSQAALAVAASVRALGEGAETPDLIRRGLKELAQQ